MKLGLVNFLKNQLNNWKSTKEPETIGGKKSIIKQVFTFLCCALLSIITVITYYGYLEKSPPSTTAFAIISLAYIQSITILNRGSLRVNLFIAIIVTSVTTLIIYDVSFSLIRYFSMNISSNIHTISLSAGLGSIISVFLGFVSGKKAYFLLQKR